MINARKLALAFLAALCLFSLTAETRTATKAANPALVRLETEGSQCSGFVVATNYIATAAHCVDEGIGQEFKITFNAQGLRTKTFEAVMVGKEGGPADYALLYGDTQEVVPLTLETEPLNSPQGVYALSARNGFHLIPGFLSAHDAQGNFVVHTIVLPGDSGSALIGDNERVVGVVWGSAYMYFGRPIALVAPITGLIQALHKLQHPQHPSHVAY